MALRQGSKLIDSHSRSSAIVIEEIVIDCQEMRHRSVASILGCKLAEREKLAKNLAVLGIFNKILLFLAAVAK